MLASQNDVINPQIILIKKTFFGRWPESQDQKKQLIKLVAANRQSELLNPCRPGARNGNNFKCANSIV